MAPSPSPSPSRLPLLAAGSPPADAEEWRWPSRGRPKNARARCGSVAAVKRRTMHVQHRCFISHYLDKIKAISPRDCHKKLFCMTPFSHFVDVPEIVCGVDLLEAILGCHKKGDCFEFGGKVVRFTQEDVGLILGLPATGEEIEIRGPVKPSSIGGMFVGEDLTREAIQVKMKDLRDSDVTHDVTDFVKLWLLYIFSTFLCPQTKHDCPKSLMCYVDDLDSLSNFCWAKVVHDVIMHKLPSVAANVKLRNQGKRPNSMGYLLGCTAVLCPWFYEHTTLFHSLRLNARPRFFGWTLDHNKKRNFWFNAIRELTPDEVIQNLLPMEDERWIIEGNNKSRAREFRLLGRETDKRMMKVKQLEMKRKGGGGEEGRDESTEIAGEEKRRRWDTRKNIRASKRTGIDETGGDLKVVGEDSEEQHLMAARKKAGERIFMLRPDEHKEVIDVRPAPKAERPPMQPMWNPKWMVAEDDTLTNTEVCHELSKGVGLPMTEVELKVIPTSCLVSDAIRSVMGATSYLHVLSRKVASLEAQVAAFKAEKVRIENTQLEQAQREEKEAGQKESEAEQRDAEPGQQAEQQATQAVGNFMKSSEYDAKFAEHGARSLVTGFQLALKCAKKVYPNVDFNMLEMPEGIGDLVDAEEPTTEES